MGHRVRALAPITPETMDAGHSFRLRYPDLVVTRFVVPHYETNPTADYGRMNDAQVLSELPRLIAEDRPDVVIIGRESFAHQVPRLARSHLIPCLLIVHGFPSRAILDGTYPEAESRHLLGEYRRVNLLVAVAGHWAARLRALGLDNVVAIQNPVDLSRFSPTPRDSALLRSLAICGDDIVVMHVANLKAVKRPLDLVESAERALSREPRLRYVIVGDGACRGAMEEACRKRRIADRFRFVGWVSHEAIPAYLNLADIVAMPSEHETQALVYLEAQACGRLLLASDIPAAREVVDDGETGLLFRKRDIDDLTAKTLRAAGDIPLRAAIGRTARERVRTHSVDTIVAAYARELSRLVHGPSDPRANAAAREDAEVHASRPGPGA